MPLTEEQHAHNEVGFGYYSDGTMMGSFFEPSEVRIRFDQETTSETGPLAPTFPSMTDRLVQFVDSRGDDDVTLRVLLQNEEFDMTQLVGTSGSVRQEIIADRRTQLAPSQDAVEVELNALGYEVLSRQWLTNGLVVRGPASSAQDLLSIGLVESVHPSARYELEWNGQQIRFTTLTDVFLNNGFHGEEYGRVSSPTNNIKLGFIDITTLNCYHVGWEDWANGPTRVVPNYCFDTGCLTNHGTFVCDDSESHATTVAWAAAGSIEQNQHGSGDPGGPISDPDAQQERSGQAPETDVYYYRLDQSGDTNCAVVEALDQAIEDGIDILNLSIGMFSDDFEESDFCDPGFNLCGLNATLQQALDAGMVIVKSSGDLDDEYPTASCNVSYPGWRPETLTVAGLETPPTVLTLPNYRGTVMLPNASHGPALLNRLGGGTGSYPVVDLVAPGVVGEYFTTEFGYADFPASDTGASYAAPIVTATAGIWRHMSGELGELFSLPPLSGYGLMTTMMVLGDGYNGGSSSSYNIKKVSVRAGYGRLRAHYPILSGTLLESPYQWQYRSFQLFDGATHSWFIGLDSGPESTSITDFKWAVLEEWSNLNQVPDIDIRIMDTCPPGGGSPDLVRRGNTSRVLRHRLRLDSDLIGGNCLQAEVEGLDVPAGGVWIHSVHYYHSGNTTLH